jgi:hypothetical protein
MTKEFIPYEQALELKELGFDEPCFAFYSKIYGLMTTSPTNKVNEFAGEVILPLYQQAFRWFRDKYGLSGWVNESFTGSSRQGVISIKSEIGLKYYPTTTKFFDIYEEAELSCLIKLIEIVKNK